MITIGFILRFYREFKDCFYIELHYFISFVFILIAIVIEQRDSITIVENFADRLRLARMARGMTQAELARACGVSQSAIANYESGSRRSAKTIFRLAHALQVQAHWLAEGKGDMSEPYLPGASPSSSSPYGSQALQLSEHLHPWGPWPFTHIQPDHYWALDASSRSLIENTVASLISSLRKDA